jgi:hypothetical protein
MCCTINILKIFSVILIVAGYMMIQSCAGLSSFPYSEIEIRMTKYEVANKLGSPTEIRESVVNAFGQTIDVWEYKGLRYYFLQDSLVKTELTEEKWDRAKLGIYRTKFGILLKKF